MDWNFLKNGGPYRYGGAYPVVSSMIGVGDVLTTSDSIAELVLEIEITML